MNYKPLSECAFFSDLRTSEITFENYISTENMIRDKGGITVAASLPDVKTTSKYEPGDVLISNIRPYFKKIWYADREGSCSNDVLVLKVKPGYLSKFLYYVLSDNNFFNYDTVTSKGTKMPRGTPHAIMKYLVPDVSLEAQQEIVDILSCFDSMIDINKRKIDRLNNVADSLYKEWFVRFRHPSFEALDKKDTNYGTIPSAFEIKQMNDIISYYIGGGWGEETEDDVFFEDAYVIRGTDFPRITNGDVSTCPLRYHKKSNYASRKLIKDDIVLEISGGTAEQPVGRTVIVTQEILNRFDNRVICASFCKLIRLDKKIVTPFYFLYWMKYLYETKAIDRYQLQSTGIINFQFEYFLRKGDILLPPMSVMEEFDSFVSPIKKEIDNLAETNDKLKLERELLLSRYVSGRLDQ